MTLDFILDNINYDLLFEDGTSLSGNIEYVSHHFSDGIVKTNTISSHQLPEIATYLADYKQYVKDNGYVDMTDFFKIWSKGVNA